MSALDAVLERLDRVRRSGRGYSARCPAHEDREPSLSISEGADGRVLLRCHAGCTVEAIVAALELDLRDLFEQEKGGNPPRSAVNTSTPPRAGLTLAAYAEAKELPTAFLEALGIAEKGYLGAPAVRFPYLDADGREVCVRYRVALDGEIKTRTKAGARHCLYGLHRLARAREAGYVVLVEGESDALTLWLHEFPALGLPGAASWRDDRDAEHVEGIPTIYVVVEPDAGGEAVLRWLAGSTIRERVRLVRLDGAKDPSELYLADRDRFRERFEAALQAATPWSAHERIASEIRARTAWQTCEQLARSQRILDELALDLDRAGLAGERKAAQLLYLIFTTRHLDRLVSVAVKGPSSGGKSYLVESVLEHFSPSAYYALSGMSERALAYGTEPLSHRFLVLYEAAGIEGDYATYLVRSLLSEGRVRYETVEKGSEGLTPRLIEREGPTGLVTTTTRIALHAENETRLLSLTIDDTAEQTRDVLLALAAENDPPDRARWRALDEWIESAEHRVTIPFAEALARLVPPIAVRLRRDFSALLSLIRASAVLHQATRERDAGGRIVATIEGDYATVRELVVDLLSEGVEATVSPTVRETVAAVDQHVNSPDDGLTVRELARVLRIDKAAASRRWQAAKALGYLKNLEDRRGRPARIVLADPLPDDVKVVPTVEALTRGVDPLIAEPDGYPTLPPPAPDETLDEALQRLEFFDELIADGIDLGPTE